MAVNFDRLWEKARAATNVDERECVRTLAEILKSKDGRKYISNLREEDAKLCVEILDHGLSRHKLHGSEKQVFFSALRRLSGKHSRLPDSMVITDKINYLNPGQVLTSGGFADIKQGEYEGCTVAVKTLRVSMTDDLRKIRKQFCQEVILWNSLSHPNVLKLVGVLGGFGEHQFATVSEWMMHGNIMEYIRKKATNRLELLHGAGQGLKYLHDANLTHGDLKGANILMTNDKPPKACLADFGFTSMVLDPENPMSCSVTLEGGTMTFMAPELLTPSKFGLQGAAPTREADIYAFGLVVVQVLTGQAPFSKIKPRELPYHVLGGVRPEEPVNAGEIGISDFLWRLIQKCWDGERTRRPQVGEVVAVVGNAAAEWGRDMPPSGTDRQEDSYVEEESDELAHKGIFESYNSDDPPPADLSSDSSRPANTITNSTQRTPPEGSVYEVVVYKHLEQDSQSPPSAIAPRKPKGLRYYLKKVFGRKSKH